MDAQVKKGLVDICVLASLSRGDSYGWQIIKDIGTVMELSESTLYPVLKRLENAKLVITYEVPHNGRLRRYFQITDDGRNRLREFKSEQEAIVRVHRYILDAIIDEGEEK